MNYHKRLCDRILAKEIFYCLAGFRAKSVRKNIGRCFAGNEYIKNLAKSIIAMLFVIEHARIIVEPMRVFSGRPVAILSAAESAQNTTEALPFHIDYAVARRLAKLSQES